MPNRNTIDDALESRNRKGAARNNRYGSTEPRTPESRSATRRDTTNLATNQSTPRAKAVDIAGTGPTFDHTIRLSHPTCHRTPAKRQTRNEAKQGAQPEPRAESSLSH